MASKDIRDLWLTIADLADTVAEQADELAALRAEVQRRCWADERERGQ